MFSNSKTFFIHHANLKNTEFNSAKSAIILRCTYYNPKIEIIINPNFQNSLTHPFQIYPLSDLLFSLQYPYNSKFA